VSRVGVKPIPVDSGVDVKIDGNLVTVKGSKGELKLEKHPDIQVELQENRIIVTRPTDNKPHRALHGLTRALLNNMVTGVTKGFSKGLEINGVGYRAQKQGKNLVLNVGYSNPVEMEPPQGVDIEVPKPNKIIVSGIDKQKVGQFAAQIRSVREPEPYKGKGIKYEDERIRRKEGKAGVAAK
jgi:large subunit ribosomal protein L6